MQTFIASVFVFGILIFFHELGHFMVAKAVGIHVHEFSMGFGPRLWGFKRGDTVYNLRAFPLGGFVRMAGMDPNEDEEEPDYDEERGFNSKTVGQRAGVIAAGPIMNFVLAAVILALIFMTHGLPVPTTDVGMVLKDSPAYHAGIKEGDRITSINGVPVEKWTELNKLVNSNAGKPIQITVERGGVEKKIEVTPRLSKEGRYIIGIQNNPEKYVMEKMNPLTALWKGAEATVQVTVLIITFVGKMIVQQAPMDIGGPVRVVAEIGQAAEKGVYQVLQLAAFLSINLGLFNLFPIPALDGSRLVFLAWEKIVGKPIDPAKEGFIHMIGFGLLLLMIVFITYNDIISLIAPGK
ncbi:regulator of sigma E protease [Desulfohalotomaculum tongense]|uniref:RIP metalloprotease RseP n=1 Tax=Desulforadius tongensis TaxID=1216062 RepID=UPI001956E04B|nr:RIP metalloprotease RseP [Desulforadius tongensis]MBM7854430.1 regulator of sigma E protease [Desulforadius tongensis]